MTTYYVKRGRRYIAVSEYDALQGTPLGWWLVHVTPGCRSARKMVDPAVAEVEAAMRVAGDAMVEAMRERCEGRLDAKMVPERDRARYQRAWEAWRAIVGDHVNIYFEGVSMQDVVDVGLSALREKMREGT